MNILAISARRKTVTERITYFTAFLCEQEPLSITPTPGRRDKVLWLQFPEETLLLYFKSFLCVVAALSTIDVTWYPKEWKGRLRLQKYHK